MRATYEIRTRGLHLTKVLLYPWAKVAAKPFACGIFVKPLTRFELATYTLLECCSTIELKRQRCEWFPNLYYGHLCKFFCWWVYCVCHVEILKLFRYSCSGVVVFFVFFLCVLVFFFFRFLFFSNGGTDMSPLVKLGVPVSLSWNSTGSPSSAGSFMSTGISRRLGVERVFLLATMTMVAWMHLACPVLLGLCLILNVRLGLCLGFKWRVAICKMSSYCTCLKEMSLSPKQSIIPLMITYPIWCYFLSPQLEHLPLITGV